MGSDGRGWVQLLGTQTVLISQTRVPLFDGAVVVSLYDGPSALELTAMQTTDGVQRQMPCIHDVSLSSHMQGPVLSCLTCPV
jgi:hypothetical protein